MIHVRIASLSVDSATNQPVIILRPIEAGTTSPRVCFPSGSDMPRRRRSFWRCRASSLRGR